MDGTLLKLFSLCIRWLGKTPTNLMGTLVQGTFPPNSVNKCLFDSPWFTISRNFDFLDLLKLKNDLVHHDMNWPPIPTKFPSYIPKFKGKYGEDLVDHVTTFHLWCYFISLNDDSIRWRLFQRTFTLQKLSGTSSFQLLLTTVTLIQ